MDRRILELFMQENHAWDDLITRQRSEIPVLEGTLTRIMRDKKNLDEQVVSTLNVLKKEIVEQGDRMEDIKASLAEQQTYLEKEKRGEPFPVQTLMSQNILRERIRNVERKFLDLKCDYMSYLASAL